MAFDPEQHNRHREARQRRRQERAARAKRMRLIALCCAGGLLAVRILTMILSLKGCES